MSDRSIRNWKRGRVDYDDPTHRYWSKLEQTNEYYISGTTLISKLKANKCWWGIAYRYAQKNGGSMAYWQQEWIKEGDKGKAKGTKYHYTQERKVLEAGGLVHREEVLPTYDHSNIVSLSSLPKGKTYVELRLWCHYAKIAGTADLVLLHEDGSVSIYDWKTNKNINCLKIWDRTVNKWRYIPYNYRDKRSADIKINSYMKAPVSHLVDTEYNHYALQLSLYAYMIELEGFTIRDLAFIHVTDNNKVYECPYMKKEIQNIVNWYNY